MHVVEVLRVVRLADLVDDAVREVRREVVHRPVGPVLGRVQRVVRVFLVPVLVLAGTLVWHADPPQLGAAAFFGPGGGQAGGFAGDELDVVLGVLPEDALSVDGEAVRASFDGGDGDESGLRVDVAPVLVRAGVGLVVLEVVAAGGEHGQGLDGALREVDFGFEGGAARGWDVVGDVLGDGVVEGLVPGWGVEFQGLVAEGHDVGSGCAFVEMVVELLGVKFDLKCLEGTHWSKGSIKAIRDVWRSVAVMVRHCCPVNEWISFPAGILTNVIVYDPIHN